MTARKPTMYVSRDGEQVKLYLVNDIQTATVTLSIDDAIALLKNLWGVIEDDEWIGAEDE